MRIVPVGGERPYEVRIQRGLIDQLGEQLHQTLPKVQTVAILTDETVDRLYGDKAEQSLKGAGLRTCRFSFPGGEDNKSLNTWGRMVEFLAENRLTRSDCVVALGGGIPGDLAGFAAACYLRGIACVQVPTTLLAMVDSSVGGKTGLNLEEGKNLAGAFHQPSLVLCDPDTLSTLPPETLADGAAESIKYGVLGDQELFDLLHGGKWLLQAEWVIERCVAAKAALVEKDEHDTGSRQLLNLGHTFAHAIEKCSRYAISHGHAVAIGMVYAARLSRRLGLCTSEVEAAIRLANQQNGLPVAAPYGADELTAVALSDKKRMGDKMTFVLPSSIGACGLHQAEVRELPQWMKMAVEE